MENSVLNNCQLIDNISEINKTTIRTIEEKNDSFFGSEKTVSLGEFSLPIDNSDTNLKFIEANMGIPENRQNVVFLEFELDNSALNKEHLKYFREVNNNFVDKDVSFVLNVKIIFHELGNCPWKENFEKGFEIYD